MVNTDITTEYLVIEEITATAYNELKKIHLLKSVEGLEIKQKLLYIIQQNLDIQPKELHIVKKMNLKM